MTREEAKDLLPIITAFAEGKTIEVNNISGHWEEINFPKFDVDSKKYRIKSKPKYRPFKDAEECWAEMLKHLPFGWVKDMDGSKFIIETVNSDGSLYVSDDGTCYFSEMLKNYTFADGTPFGVKIEEE